MLEAARRFHWGVIEEVPPDPAKVPTLIRNPRWIRIIEPVMDFIGTVPGYGEYDVSLWFLVSLSLFFAMLVGDAGYGCLLLAGTFLARRCLTRAPRAPFVLFYVFGAATVLWGALSGTWFGVESLGKAPFLRGFVVAAMDGFSGDQAFMMRLCFLLGAFHLSLAHVLRGLRHPGSVRVIGEAGRICLIWSLYLATCYFVLGEGFPPVGAYLFAAGAVSTGLCSGPGRGVMSVVRAAADLPFGIIRSFSDLVSYIRLFAVGYATLVVAASFNHTASSLGGPLPLKIAGCAAVLLLGHAMNIMLAAMGVLVHGIRLNMLEFSSHLEMNWTGTGYRPFVYRGRGDERSNHNGPGKGGD